MLRGNKQFTPKLPIFHLVDFKIHRYLSMLCLTWLHMLQDAQCCLNDWAILALWERWIHSEICLYWESLTALKVPVAGTSLAVGQHDQAVEEWRWLQATALRASFLSSAYADSSNSHKCFGFLSFLLLWTLASSTLSRAPDPAYDGSDPVVADQNELSTSSETAQL